MYWRGVLSENKPKKARKYFKKLKKVSPGNLLKKTYDIKRLKNSLLKTGEIVEILDGLIEDGVEDKNLILEIAEEYSHADEKYKAHEVITELINEDKDNIDLRIKDFNYLTYCMELMELEELAEDLIHNFNLTQENFEEIYHYLGVNAYINSDFDISNEYFIKSLKTKLRKIIS